MKFAKLAAAAAALAIMPAMAHAQDAAPAAAAVSVTQGAAVTGNDGNPVGTVTEVNGDIATVNTGKHSVPLPLNAFGSDANGLTLNITKTDLDTMIDQQLAEAAAALNQALVTGAAVGTADAQPLGVIDTIEGENVVLAMSDDQKVTLGKDMFALDDNGGVIVLATLAQIEAAIPSEG